MYPLQNVRVVRCGASLCVTSWMPWMPWMLWMLASCIDQPAPIDDPVSQVESEIVNGWDMAGTYPEFVSVNADGFACSAVLVAPRLALTAGHCHGTGMEIYRNGIAHIPVNRVVWWGDGSSGEDFALLELTQPVYIGRYPAIGTDLAVGNTVTQIGRIHGGQITDSGWGVTGRTVTRFSSNPDNFLVAGVAVEHGDSGGPNFIDGTHILVGVNSTVGSDETAQAWTNSYWASQISQVAQSWGYSVNVIHALRLQSVFDDRLLDDTGWSKSWGTVVQQWDFTGQANQMWYLTTGLNNDNWSGTEIRNLYSNLCLDVPSSSSSNGVKIQQWGCNATNAQSWNFAGNAVRSVATGKCLDVSDRNPNNGVQIQQWDCASQSNQAWRVW